MAWATEPIRSACVWPVMLLPARSGGRALIWNFSSSSRTALCPWSTTGPKLRPTHSKTTRKPWPKGGLGAMAFSTQRTFRPNAPQSTHRKRQALHPPRRARCKKPRWAVRRRTWVNRRLQASLTKPTSTAAISEAQSAPAILLDNIVKFFGRFAALRGISASFAPGRLYVVVGDNGAGKSTLLRVVAGLMEPSQGSLTLLGSKKPLDVAHRIGYMGHAPLLYDELNGMENLRYFAGLYGIGDDEVSRAAMRTVGLDPQLTRRVGQYSQGMRQRLSLARSVLHDPELILLDEPFSNVDVHSARAMATVLGKVRDAGKTIFVVTHQASLLENVADEFVHMSAGLIVARTPTANAAVDGGLR